MRKSIFTVLLLCISIIAGATPIKNMHITLEVANSGACTVYITSEDPNPKIASVEGASTEIQCTITEADNAYPVTLHANAAPGWEFIGFTNILREDGNYQNEDFVSKDNPAKVYTEIPRSTNTLVGVGVSTEELEAKRDEARNVEPWPDEPDARYYAVFVKDDGRKMLSGVTRYAENQEPDGSGSLGMIVQPEVIFEGDEVTATAVPNAGCSFVEWTNADGSSFSNSPSITFTAAQDLVYTAHFQLDDITIGECRVASFSSTKAVKMNSRVDVKAFIVSSISSEKVNMRQVDFIPHDTGVLLLAQAQGDYTLDAETSALDEFVFLTSTDKNFHNDNKLYGTGGEAIKTDGTFYVLANKSQGLGFYRMKLGENVPAGKAYVKMSSDFKPDFIELNLTYWDVPAKGNTTAITQVETVNEATYYNIQGQRVNNNYKGLTIVNGKKHICK